MRVLFPVADIICVTLSYLRCGRVAAMCLLVFSGVAMAQGDDTTLTNGEPNGRMWNKLDDSARVVYVAGIRGGVNLLGGYLNTSDKDIEVFYGRYTNLEMATEVTKLYSDPANANITVSLIYLAGVFVFKGAPPDETQRLLALFRQKAEAVVKK
jgi:hypothetical protein